MANTYTALFFHLVFSTKHRAPLIQPEIETRVWEYIGGIARKHQTTAIQVGGIEDHIHALVMAPPTIAPYQIAKSLKGDSSNWIHDTFPDLQDFGWQDGYGAFSVSKSNVPAIVTYIQDQRRHHQTQTFQEETLSLLQKHGVDYDERYLWG